MQSRAPEVVVNTPLGVYLSSLGADVEHYIENNIAFRINQKAPVNLSKFSNVKGIDAWIDKLYKTENRIITELVISLYLTRETVNRTIELIKEFRFDNLNKENVGQFLQQLRATQAICICLCKLPLG